MARSGRFGTAFEALEDGDGPIKKRPKHVHEEIVTDDRGRRRFHGAFSGGFSAGYFNSVGSKHGWVPQTFKSSKDKRAQLNQARPEDFMDEEDLGEFGIASRDFQVNKKYIKNKQQGADLAGLAVWDRPSVAGAALDDLFKISEKQASESIGYKIMKNMGYREGKGIGAPLSRKQLELQRLNEDRAFNRKSRFDRTAVDEAEEFAKGFQFIPEDIPPVYFTCKENDHGLGYQKLKGLSGGYQSTPLVDEKSKRGAAFGVGVFEDSDEDIYGTEDMSKYSFELAKTNMDPMAVMTVKNTGSDVYNTEFVPAKKPRKRPPHLSITVPASFNPRHVPIPFDSSKLPQNVREYGRNMSVIQRAMILGENTVSIMDMLTFEDREKLRQARRIADEARKTKKEAPKPKEIRDPFIDKDEEKSYRFHKYLECLKRGVMCGKPAGMPIEQWRVEEEEFQAAVPQDLRHFLPDIKERKKPLYKGDFAKTLMNKLKSKFISNDEIATAPTLIQTEKKIDAFVKMEWHPSKKLCKRLNVPDPFPYSQSEGIPGVESKVKPKKEFTTTEFENELNMRGPTQQPKEEEKVTKVEEPSEPDPLFDFFDMMDAVFGTNDQELKEGEKLEEQAKKETELAKKEAERRAAEEQRERQHNAAAEEVKHVRTKSPPQRHEYRSFFDLQKDAKKTKETKVKQEQKYSDEEEDSLSSSSEEDERSKKRKKKRKKDKEHRKESTHHRSSRSHSKKKHKKEKEKKKHKKESSKKTKKHKSRSRRSSSDSDSVIVVN